MSKMHSHVRPVATRWHEVVLVCGKCSKKVGGGFGSDGGMRLDKALRQELGVRKGRKGKIGFVRAACFDICPKNAIVVAKGSEPDRLYIIPRGTPVEEVATALDLARPRDIPQIADPLGSAKSGIGEAETGVPAR